MAANPIYIFQNTGIIDNTLVLPNTISQDSKTSLENSIRNVIRITDEFERYK